MANAGYDGVKVFSATKAADRQALGDKLTSWLNSKRDVSILDTVVRQSSDQQFHCLSILVFYRQR